MDGTEIQQPWGTFAVARRRPHPALRGVVTAYRGFMLRTERPLERIDTPVGLPALVIGFGQPIRMWHAPSSPERCSVLTSFVSGLRTRAVRIVTPTDLQGIEILLAPDGAHLLFGAPMYEFVDALYDAGDVLGSRVAFLPERLSAAGGWAERFDLLDAALLDWFDPPYEAYGELRWAWERLHNGRGGTRIDRLADEIGWSQRRLELAFRRHVGPSPKAVSRMTRFRRAVRLMVTHGMAQADVAAECGYYDQAHLIREFRAVTGMTPREFALRGATLDPVDDLGLAGAHATSVIGQT